VGIIGKMNIKYLEFIRGKPCLICGKPGVPHHFGLGEQGKGMGTKCDDTYTVPLGQVHHDWIHGGKSTLSKEVLFDIFCKHRDRLMTKFKQRKEIYYGGKNC
jgi:hypothetical protein